jgi:hypothetical protein
MIIEGSMDKVPRTRNLKVILSVLCITAIVFLGVSLIPILFFNGIQNRAGIFYGVLFFVALLTLSVFFVMIVQSSENHLEQRDYRVIHYMLRIALVSVIGAITIGILVLISQLGFINS